MNVKLYNQEGKEIGKVDLPEAVFGLAWNGDLVQQVVTSQLANQRSKAAHVKNRAEVRGGGRKPWRQKGTGRARHGSIRSPLWKGGGVTHGPTKERNFKKKINKKMARKALYTALSAKVRDQEILVLDDLKFAKPKTKEAAKIFDNLAKIEGLEKIKKGNGVLVALNPQDQISKRSLRNLPYVAAEEARNLNTLEVLRYKYILFPQNVLGNFK